MSAAKHDNMTISEGVTHGPKETLPHVGKPLDGSQYLNVIEEQIYSELPPTPQEQQPIRARHADAALKQESERHEQVPEQSVGGAKNASH